VRAYLAYAATITLLLIFTVQPAAAFTDMGIPYISSCGFVYMQPFSAADLTITEFNSARAATRDFETLDIDFPLFTDGFASGPTAGALESGDVTLGAGATSNILPFGPVNMAFPSIGQTTFKQAEYERTYFYIDSTESA
jgi:hypothetical protein